MNSLSDFPHKGFAGWLFANAGIARACRAGERAAGWWARELISCLPQRLKLAFFESRCPLILEVEPGRVSVFAQSRGEIQKIGELPEGRDAEEFAALLTGLEVRFDAVELRISPDLVFRTSLRVPESARGKLQSLLRHELERRTPLLMDQILFDFSSRASGRGYLSVDVVIAERALLDPLVECLPRPGAPIRAGIIGDNRFDLLRNNGYREGRASRLLGAAAICLGLVVSAVQVVSYRHGAAIESLNRELAVARDAMREFEQAESEHKLLLRQGDYLFSRKHGTAILHVLRDITELLPDDTWLTGMQLSANEGRIAGYAPSAAALIQRIEASPAFVDARFRSPTTAGSPDGLERFEISFAFARRQS